MRAVAADMNEIFPDFITGALLNAFKSLKENYPLFVSAYAILLGTETRMSFFKVSYIMQVLSLFNILNRLSDPIQ